MKSLKDKREATGGYAPPAVTPMEAAVAQYALAAGQAAIPVPVAPNPQYVVDPQTNPQYTIAPASPQLVAAGSGLQYPLTGVLPMSSLPPVATNPLSPAAVQPAGALGSAPPSPSMIGTLAVGAGGSASLGLQGLGPGVPGVPPTYPQVPVATPLPAGSAGVAYPGAAVFSSMGQVPPGQVPLDATYIAQQQAAASAAAAAALFGAPVRVAPGRAGVPGVPGPYAAGLPPVAAVPAQPGAGPQGVVVGQSATPIADSVLLGHALGDEAAPPPNLPLPVVAPLAPTSGLLPEQVRCNLL